MTVLGWWAREIRDVNCSVFYPSSSAAKNEQLAQSVRVNLARLWENYVELGSAAAHISNKLEPQTTVQAHSVML
jgi:hypothetical protein